MTVLTLAVTSSDPPAKAVGSWPRNACVDALRNDPLDCVLHVVVVNSNPCGFARRNELALQFLLSMKEAQNVEVYVVELAHEGQTYVLTEANNPRHLRLRGGAPLWHKENMINLGVRALLPPDWKAFAWVDADIEFENPRWALDALRVLNGSADIVQMWSHAVDMNAAGHTMKVFESFSLQHVRAAPFVSTQWHPGFAWAMTRKAFEQTNGLYEVSILGSGDMNMAMSLRGQALDTLNYEASDDYKASLASWQSKAQGLRLAYVPGVIRHHFHGNKRNRQYDTRWQILIRHGYQPSAHIRRGAQGVLEPTEQCPPSILSDIVDYFKARNEDE